MGENLKDLPLSTLGRMIRRDWGVKVNFAARPYLEALCSLESVSDNFLMDSGDSVVRYFLCNASSWRGPVAKEIKKELKRRIGMK